MTALISTAAAVAVLWWIWYEIDAYRWNRKVDAWADAMHRRGERIREERELDQVERVFNEFQVVRRRHGISDEDVEDVYQAGDLPAIARRMREVIDRLEPSSAECWCGQQICRWLP